MNAITAHSSQLTAHSSQLTAHSSQLTAHSSQLTAHADYVIGRVFCQPLKQAFSRFCEKAFCFSVLKEVMKGGGYIA
ncbi:hypothetical protein [Streptococcus pluranimalium]|uniref:hypothetical protein n=1 Tax=Streptococcus pluranimalium TaxID=82348 RepID=UPI003BF7A0DD